MSVNPNSNISLSLIKIPQESWLDAFNKAVAESHDEFLIEELSNDFDVDEWQW